MSFTQAELYALLPSVAKSAFRVEAEEVVGEYVTATYEGNDRWDVWIRSPGFMQGDVLSERKLSGILGTLPEGVPTRRLTGEAVVQLTTSQLLDAQRTLGIRHRRADALTTDTASPLDVVH